MHEHMRRQERQRQLLETLGLTGSPQGTQMRKISDYPNWDDADVLYTDFYTYNAAFGTVAGSQTSDTQIITVQADSKFEWMKSTCWGYKDGATEPYQSTDVLPMTVIIQDSGSGRLLMNGPVPLVNIAGTGQLPFILPESRIFQPNSTISIVLNNLSATQYDNVNFSLVGRKIFRGQPG